MGFFKTLFKKRVNCELVAGGRYLSEKVPVRFFNIVQGDSAGKVVIEIPSDGNKEFKLIDVDWHKSKDDRADITLLNEQEEEVFVTVKADQSKVSKLKILMI